MLLLLIGLESCEMIETLKYRFNTNPGGSFALPQTQASHALNHAAVKQYLNTKLLIEGREKAFQPVAALVSLPTFLTVQHLELCQLKLFLPLDKKCKCNSLSREKLCSTSYMDEVL